MYLALRTDSATSEISLLEPDGTELRSERWESGRQLSSQLLDHIQKLLDQQGTAWTELTGIIVFRGPGSFTGLRIGVSVANAIAYAQGIPIVGTAGSHWARDGSRRLRAGETDTRVVPAYGSEPNISRPGPGA